MPIHMRRVDSKHSLVLDINTDMSHLIRNEDPDTHLFSFDSGGDGRDQSGDIRARVRMRNNTIDIENSMGIVIEPVSASLHDAYFRAETDFLAQWLVVRYEGAAP